MFKSVVFHLQSVCCLKLTENLKDLEKKLKKRKRTVSMFVTAV